MSNKPRWFGGKPKNLISKKTFSFHSQQKNELFTPFWATSQLWTIRKYGLIMPTSSSWPNKLQKKCDFYELSLILISQIAIKKFAYSKNPARSVWVLFNESSGSCAGEKWFVEFTFVCDTYHSVLFTQLDDHIGHASASTCHLKWAHFIDVGTEMFSMKHWSLKYYKLFIFIAISKRNFQVIWMLNAC